MENCKSDEFILASVPTAPLDTAHESRGSGLWMEALDWWCGLSEDDEILSDNDIGPVAPLPPVGAQNRTTASPLVTCAPHNDDDGMILLYRSLEQAHRPQKLPSNRQRPLCSFLNYLGTRTYQVDPKLARMRMNARGARRDASSSVNGKTRRNSASWMAQDSPFVVAKKRKFDIASLSSNQNDTKEPDLGETETTDDGMIPALLLGQDSSCCRRIQQKTHVVATPNMQHLSPNDPIIVYLLDRLGRLQQELAKNLKDQERILVNNSQELEPGRLVA